MIDFLIDNVNTLFTLGDSTNILIKKKAQAPSILSTGPCTAPNILWLETALWCASPMDIRFALKSRSRCKFGREIEQQNYVSLSEHGAKLQINPELLLQFGKNLLKNLFVWEKVRIFAAKKRMRVVYRRDDIKLRNHSI